MKRLKNIVTLLSILSLGATPPASVQFREAKSLNFNNNDRLAYVTKQTHDQFLVDMARLSRKESKEEYFMHFVGKNITVEVGFASTVEQARLQKIIFKDTVLYKGLVKTSFLFNQTAAFQALMKYGRDADSIEFAHYHPTSEANWNYSDTIVEDLSTVNYADVSEKKELLPSYMSVNDVNLNNLMAYIFRDGNNPLKKTFAIKSSIVHGFKDDMFLYLEYWPQLSKKELASAESRNDIQKTLKLRYPSGQISPVVIDNAWFCPYTKVFASYYLEQ